VRNVTWVPPHRCDLAWVQRTESNAWESTTGLRRDNTHGVVPCNRGKNVNWLWENWSVARGDDTRHSYGHTSICKPLCDGGGWAFCWISFASFLSLWLYFSRPKGAGHALRRKAGQEGTITVWRLSRDGSAILATLRGAGTAPYFLNCPADELRQSRHCCEICASLLWCWGREESRQLNQCRTFRACSSKPHDPVVAHFFGSFANSNRFELLSNFIGIRWRSQVVATLQRFPGRQGRKSTVFGWLLGWLLDWLVGWWLD
jgi:hypothetical protein